jgi:hypothetical protein
MCEGATLDECRFAIHGIIDRYGWFIQYVEVDPITRAWAYTIGLSAGFEHPELIIAGVRPEGAAPGTQRHRGDDPGRGLLRARRSLARPPRQMHPPVPGAPASLRAGCVRRVGGLLRLPGGPATRTRGPRGRLARSQGTARLPEIADRLVADLLAAVRETPATAYGQGPRTTDRAGKGQRGDAIRGR